MKKNLRSLVRTMSAFVLCCAILAGSALAANTEQVYHINGNTLTFGDTDPKFTPSPIARERYFADYTMTTSRSHTVSATCRPSYGNYLYIAVENLGDTYLRLELELTGDGIPVTDRRTLEPGEGPIITTYDATDTNDLSCDFTITVSPVNDDEEITFELVAAQLDR